MSKGDAFINGAFEEYYKLKITGTNFSESLNIVKNQEYKFENLVDGYYKIEVTQRDFLESNDSQKAGCIVVQSIFISNKVIWDNKTISDIKCVNGDVPSDDGKVLYTNIRGGVPIVGEETKKYNYIICGGGASGLLLANNLVSDPFFLNKNILLIEKDSKKINDRTWCFWEKGKSDLDEIVSRTWNSAYFKAQKFEKKFFTEPYTYKMIRGIDFYKKLNFSESKHQNLTYLNAEINLINKTHNIVTTNKGIFSGDYIFSSIYDINILKNQTKYPLLKQHFLGQLVVTENKIFSPDIVTLMDFDLPQENSTRFMYVLPFSKTKALVEYTLFSSSLLEKEEYIKSIKNYLKNRI